MRALNVTPPTEGSTPSGKALEEKLEPLSGKQFDDGYIKAMVMDHTKAMISFKQNATEGTNPQVKQAAEQGMQVLQEHLRMAHELAKNHNVPMPE